MEKFESAGISYFNESNEVKLAQIKMSIDEKEEQNIELESSLED